MRGKAIAQVLRHASLEAIDGATADIVKCVEQFGKILLSNRRASDVEATMSTTRIVNILRSAALSSVRAVMIITKVAE